MYEIISQEKDPGNNAVVCAVETTCRTYIMRTKWLGNKEQADKVKIRDQDIMEALGAVVMSNAPILFFCHNRIHKGNIIYQGVKLEDEDSVHRASLLIM